MVPVPEAGIAFACLMTDPSRFPDLAHLLTRHWPGYFAELR
jgi:hypothetical protein